MRKLNIQLAGSQNEGLTVIISDLGKIQFGKVTSNVKMFHSDAKKIVRAFRKYLPATTLEEIGRLLGEAK